MTIEEILKSPKVLHCIGALDGYTLFERVMNWLPDSDVGVWIDPDCVTSQIWDRFLLEMKDCKNASRPKNVFLTSLQTQYLLSWAQDKITPYEKKLPDCDDCKNTRWCVGLCEVKKCPTCMG